MVERGWRPRGGHSGPIHPVTVLKARLRMDGWCWKMTSLVLQSLMTSLARTWRRRECVAMKRE